MVLSIKFHQVRLQWVRVLKYGKIPRNESFHSKISSYTLIQLTQKKIDIFQEKMSFILLLWEYKCVSFVLGKK